MNLWNVLQKTSKLKLILKRVSKRIRSRTPTRAPLGSDHHGVKAAPREGKAVTEKLNTIFASLLRGGFPFSSTETCRLTDLKVKRPYKRLRNKKERHKPPGADSGQLSVQSTLGVTELRRSRGPGCGEKQSGTWGRDGGHVAPVSTGVAAEKEGATGPSSRHPPRQCSSSWNKQRASQHMDKYHAWDS